MEQKRLRDSKGREGEETMPYCLLHLPLGECMSTFNLEKAVCNHGFFMMAPNLWIPSTKTLQRPLRLADSTTSVTVSISHPPNHTSLHVRVHGTKHVPSADQQAILEQVTRMLRISERDERDVREFQKAHSEAKEKGFGRVFRSPSLFEDAVKSILLCNCSWMRTLDMARALCKVQSELTDGLISHILEPKGEEFIANATMKGLNRYLPKKKKGVKRKQATNIPSKVNKSVEAGSNLLLAPPLGNFPSPKEVATLNEEILRNQCNLGYRARSILELARKVESGNLKLKKFEEEFDMTSYEKVYENLMETKGFGPFACANVLMCIGFYQKVPEDSETIRHLQKKHGRESCTKATVGKVVKEIYEKYAPFQCLAYWFELWEYYENKFGKLSELPYSEYRTVTGSGPWLESSSKLK